MCDLFLLATIHTYHMLYELFLVLFHCFHSRLVIMYIVSLGLGIDKFQKFVVALGPEIS
jgi:hypothetical protein